MSTRSAAFAVLALVAALSAPPALAAPPPIPAPCGAAIFNTPTQKGVQLIWSNVAGETGYRIYRNGTLVATVGPDVNQLFDYEYPIPGDYVYCIEAFNADGPSPQCCSAASSSLLAVATVAPEDWYQDSFPATENDALPGTVLFDIEPARIGSGHNILPLTGNLLRSDVPADGAWLTPTAAVARVDLVFRVLPGPGNYSIVGFTGSGLIPLPLGPRPVPLIAPGDGSFWSKYIAANGAFGTGSPGTNGIPHHANGTDGTAWANCWNPNTWNSEQCALIGGVYVTNQFVAPAVKNIPDGLLPAGSHVEYFFRVITTTGGVILIPDTTKVLQTDGERSIDGHRWEAFSVLPDRWKEPAYGGMGMAPMLVVDLCDRRGNERIWAGLADSTGATAQSRWGAHTGWHAIGGGADIDVPSNNLLRDGVTPGFTAAHLGQPGTTWDLYNVKGVESLLTGNAGALGSRLSHRPAPALWLGQESRQGPTPQMLSAYYRQLLIFTGDLHQWILGPFNDRSQDDVTILENFMLGADPAHPRGVFIEGEGFVESESLTGLVFPSHATLLNADLGVDLRDTDYRAASGNAAAEVQVTTMAPHTPGLFSVQNNGDGDVLDLTLLPEAQIAALWQDVGVGAPYVASVYKPSTVARPWVSLVDGWNIARLGTGKGFACLGCVGSRPAPEPAGVQRSQTAISRLVYFYGTFNEIFGGVAAITGAPNNTIDVPRGPAGAPFLKLLNNPALNRNAVIRFELSAADRVEIRIYDAAGRRVRMLVHQLYGPGEWNVPWDGADDAGRVVDSGVYIAHVRLASRGVEGSKKLVLLR